MHHHNRQQRYRAFQGEEVQQYIKKRSNTKATAKKTVNSAQLTCIWPMINRSCRSMSANVTKEDWATPSGWSTSPRASTTLMVSDAAPHSRRQDSHREAVCKQKRRTTSPPTDHHRVYAEERATAVHQTFSDNRSQAGPSKPIGRTGGTTYNLEN